MSKILRSVCLIITLLILLLLPNSGLAQNWSNSYSHQPANSPFQLKMEVEVSGATVTRQYREGIFNVIEGTIQPGGDVTVTINGSGRADFEDCPKDGVYPSVAYANYIYPGANISAGKNNQRTGQGGCRYGFHDSVSYQYKFNENDLAKGIEINGWIGIKYASENLYNEQIKIKCKFRFADGDPGPSGPSEPPSQNKVEGIKITNRPAGSALKVYESYQLEAEVFPQTAGNKKILWDATGNFVEIDRNTGLLTGLAPGTTTVWAYSDENKNIRDSITIYVVPEIEVRFSPQFLNLAPPYIDAFTGGTEEKTVYVGAVNLGVNDPESDFTIDWVSSHPEIVSVTEVINDRNSFKVTAKSLTPDNYPGLDVREGATLNAVLSCTVNMGINGTTTVDYDVTVSYIPVERLRIVTPYANPQGRNYLIVFDPKIFSDAGELYMQAYIRPENATNPAIHWVLHDQNLGSIRIEELPGTSKTNATFVVKPQVRYGKTFITAESVTNPLLLDYIDLYIQDEGQIVPEKFYFTGVDKSSLTEEQRELIQKAQGGDTVTPGMRGFQNLISSPAWKALDYLPKKWILNAFIEVMMGKKYNSSKEIIIGLIGNRAQAIDHLMQYLAGQDYFEIYMRNNTELKSRFPMYDPNIESPDYTREPQK